MNETLLDTPIFDNIYKTVYNFDYSIKQNVTHDGIYYKWYELFSKLMNDYIQLPFKDRLLFKGISFSLTTILPSLADTTYSLVTRSERKNLKPLWYFGFKNAGSIYVLVDVALNALSIVVTSYIGDAFLSTSGHALVALDAVSQKYGLKTTSISFVKNLDTAIPLLISETANSFTSQIYNDSPNFNNYFLLFGIGYFLFILYQNKK
jgi:hypothetical protein